MQASIIEWQIAGALVYLMIIPLIYGFLERRWIHESFGKPWYAVIWPQWAFVWPLALVWLLALSWSLMMYSFGRDWS